MHCVCCLAQWIFLLPKKFNVGSRSCLWRLHYIYQRSVHLATVRIRFLLFNARNYCL